MLKRAVAALVPTAASAHLGMVDSSVAVKAGAEQQKRAQWQRFHVSIHLGAAVALGGTGPTGSWTKRLQWRESVVGCSAETFNGASCCTLLHATEKLFH